MESILSSKLILFGIFVAILPFCTGFGLNPNGAAGANGVVCAVFRPGADAVQTLCVQCDFTSRQLCAQNLLASLGLQQICSNNVTNSTIPTGVCVVCRTQTNVISICTGSNTIANNMMITDAMFACLERRCAQTIEFFYTGFTLAQMNKVLRFPFNGGAGTNVLGKRDAEESGSSRPTALLDKETIRILVREYFSVEIPIENIRYVTVESDE